MAKRHAERRWRRASLHVVTLCVWKLSEGRDGRAGRTVARLHRAVFWQLPHGPLEPPLDEVAHHGVWPLSTVVQALYFLPLYAKGKTQAPPWPVPPVVLHTMV